LSNSGLKRLFRGVAVRAQALFAHARPRLIYGLESGRGAKVYGNVRFRITDEGSARLGENVVIERFSEITCKGGSLYVGDNSFIGQGSIIVAKRQITIGSDCLIANNVSIRDQNHSFGVGILTRNAGFTVKPVEIGRNVWLGSGVVVLPGVRIGDGCVVGAGSIVTKSLPPNSIAVGNPACVIRTITE